MEPKKYRIIILGAGFSKAASFPLAAELWNEVRKRACSLEGRAEKFHEDLKTYLDYKRDCDGVAISEEQVNFEEFLGFLDIEHFLGLRGSDTWSTDGNEGTLVVKTLIAGILTELSPRPDAIPRLYLEFAKALQPDDIVLTFNYDVLLESALEAVGKPYRLFPTRYESVNETYAVVDDSRGEVVVLKLHGSIDWFDRGSYVDRERLQREAGLSTAPIDPVFNSSKPLGLTKILDGPWHDDDPLNQMFRVRNIKALKHSNYMFSVTPWMLAPSTFKILNASKIRNFWHGLGQARAFNFGLAIVGYSLPPQDDYAQQVIYSLVTNYQRNYPNEEVFAMKKSPLVIVNLCKSAEQLKTTADRYRFVNWEKAILYKGGFDNKSLALIFA
ncbi:SIR2 family protein [Nitrospira defluvii]|nr:SIR2 family protein [Nitrospira defluvii]